LTVQAIDQPVLIAQLPTEAVSALQGAPGVRERMVKYYIIIFLIVVIVVIVMILFF
jgi:t-SNARE complex subunit (syntaxin)